MTTDLDLDDLERKARSASPGIWRPGADDGETGTSVLRDDGDDLWQVADRCTPADAIHIAANSPPVTIALVARVRRAEKARDEAQAEVLRLRDELAAFAVAVALDSGSRVGVDDVPTQVEIPASLAAGRRDLNERKVTDRIQVPETMADVIEGGLR
jgi:hypothetical protein